MIKGIKKRKMMKLLIPVLILAMLLGLMPTAVFADSVPTFTGAAYNANTGVLTISGSGFATNASDKIDLSKFIITNGIDQGYILKTKGVATVTGAAITLSDAEQTALSKFLDKNGTSALNGGTYQVNVLNGWNGPTSTTDFSTHGLTVSNLTVLSTATYDCSTGKLVITGSNFIATNGLNNDISPKYLTITDSKYKTYTLTTKGVDIDSATQATITMNPADKAALESLFDKNGTSSTVAGGVYNIVAAAGWDGTKVRASYVAHGLTVSNYATPVVSIADITVTVGGSITIPANSITKTGTVYVVPSTFTVNGKTQADLDAMAVSGSAIKASVTDVTKAITISTRTSTSCPFTLATDTATFKLVAVDKAGALSPLSANTITINNVAVATLSATAAKGGATGTTKVTVTAVSGDSIVIVKSSSSIDIPKVGATAPGGAVAYVSGDISGVDATTTKYLGVYELDKNNKVVKFKLITITAAVLK